MPKQSDIRIYRLNDIETWAGRSKEECLEAARKQGLEHYGPDDLDEYYDPEEARELTDKEMREKVLFDPEADTRRPFAEALQQMIDNGDSFPCLFSSTEY